MTRRVACLLSLLLALPAAATNGLAVAREALRDGLWDVARHQAARVDSPSARLLVLESFAREERWRDLLARLSAWGDPADEGCRVYRALARLRTGDTAGARTALDGAAFSDPRFAAAAARVQAELALAAGDVAAARRLLEKKGGGSVEAKMLLAEAYARSDARRKAEAIWREVAARTNAPERARFIAADNLADVAVLRALRARLTVPALRRRTTLRLGVTLVKDEATFDEGASLIRSLVHDAPDLAGARDAFLALAQAQLARQAWAAAEKTLREASEIWPDVARDAVCQERLGWALAGLGRHEAALGAFDRAVAAAPDGPDKARVMVKTGDMLSALGREKEATARYREVQRRYPATPAGERVAGLLRLREMEAQARALYGDYRFADARKLFETLAREDPARQARMEFCLVLCLYGQGLDEEAARRARALAEGNAEEAVRAEASRWLAKLAYNQGRWREAADLFSAAADARGTPADVAAESLVWAARAACAGNDYPRAVATIARFVSHHAASPLLAAALTVQGEALIELARFDEAVLVFDRAVAAAGASADDRLRAELLRADALFAMGADNPARYHAALTAYQTAVLGENLTATQRVTLSFKIARTLEKLKRTEEAVDQYYTQVVLAYRAGVARGESYEDEARAVFSRAALRLADEYESRGRDFQAIRVLELVVASRVPAADEAARRIARLRRKGDSL